ncbi:hypothetical protein CANCADRAFT_30396 [Tortispora caseinolytica NRRL Y-17796]|uniref:Uncharacterized protein n=1 Tax=Tortispora caseinolytica NRRL Y-17796 TaxID=767744 RepID=A0A1E4TK71_9ASCO|nr:hypothetical protein CANCADRAFT_30396 [Tortispora caseinolytica NRRL Y-17796]
MESMVAAWTQQGIITPLQASQIVLKPPVALGPDNRPISSTDVRKYIACNNIAEAEKRTLPSIVAYASRNKLYT